MTPASPASGVGPRAGALGGDGGALLIEIALGLSFLFVVTIAILGGINAKERFSIAQEIAQETSRTYVTAASDTEGRAEATRVANEIAANHGVTPGHMNVRLDGSLRRGGQITACVEAYVPVVPATAVGGFTRTFCHTETVDPYRSL
ncbi:MAG: hypothetical protein IT198_14090 [Acidimicrobiia bacterium]|nr:hypothetical protein [Acidimicrobiia bacterium]